MKVAIPKERFPGETRVAVPPEGVQRFVKKGFEVLVEAGAGAAASHSDAEYEEAGATVVSSSEALYAEADLVVRIHAPEGEDLDLLKEGQAVIGLLFPLTNHELVDQLVSKKVDSFSLDQVPRITRAQSMDVLSSQSTVAGYKAVLEASTRTPKFFPMLTTAAGTIRPAKVTVLGAGVAGLQAIATARRLGAVVQGYDIRAATKEQVESLGASFLELPSIGETETQGGYARELSEEEKKLQQQHLAEALSDSDVIVTTALIPGRPAPVLITEAMAEKLKPGCVVLDMAAANGGNCEPTRPGEDVVAHGVTYVGPTNLPATLPQHASQMFGRNLFNLLVHLAPEGELAFDFEDEITKGCCITHQGTLRHEATLARREDS